MRLYIKVIDKKMEREGDMWIFTVRAESGGESIKFRIECPNWELNPENIEKINESFRNSLRYVKHYAGYPDKTATEKDMKAAMNKLSSTLYGIGIKISEDPLPEFIPFSL